MEDLPSEMINEILSRLDKPSLFQASNVCKLWREQSLTHVVTFNTMMQFKQAVRDGDRLSIIKSKPMYDEGWIEFSLVDSCYGGHKDIVELIMAKGSTSYQSGLHGACMGGHKELAELMIAKGARCSNSDLLDVCRGGHRHMVELLIANGVYYFNGGLDNACRGGHKDLVDLMIAKGATACRCGKSITDH